ncbi:uncharacterized protein [Rutidosis leptorrhynchoides]|uniref:uncharacterized protein n=1 Tax=Rutidosis leptorrhynchoides TaxID=125765 RepID=UPI003A9A3D0C
MEVVAELEWAISTRILSELINNKTLRLNTSGLETVRNSLVPNKVEVFVWRSRKKHIPVLIEFDKCGVDLNSVRCPIFDQGLETVDHSLLLCNLAYEVWLKVFDWWGHGGVTNLSISELFLGKSNVRMLKEGHRIWQAVEWTCGYLIRKNRNLKVFKNKCFNPSVALNDIQVKSFEWIVKRCKSKKNNWHDWFHNPQSLVV